MTEYVCEGPPGIGELDGGNSVSLEQRGRSCRLTGRKQMIHWPGGKVV